MGMYIRTTARGANRQRERSIQQRATDYITKHRPDVLFINDWAAGKWMPPDLARSRARLAPKRGWPDMFIAYANHGYHGLALELKREGVNIYVRVGPRKGELVKNEQIQLEAKVLESFNEGGYLGRISVGWNNTKRILDWYLDIKPSLFNDESEF